MKKASGDNVKGEESKSKIYRGKKVYFQTVSSPSAYFFSIKTKKFNLTDGILVTNEGNLANNKDTALCHRRNNLSGLCRMWDEENY